MAVTNFEVVEAPTIAALEVAVNAKIAVGFQPSGSPLAVPVYSPDGRLMRTDFYQAIVEEA
jgi:hypothetical protein